MFHNAVRSTLSFFSQRKHAVPAAAGAITATVFMIPSAIELTPLGAADRLAADNRDRAKQDYDAALDAFTKGNNALIEAKQRVNDLYCAIPGYPGFNQALEEFQARITNSSAAIADFLTTNWGLSAVADTTTTTVTNEEKSYQVYVPDTCYRRQCSTINGEQTCRTVSYDCSYYVTRYYQEITTTYDHKKNILTGPGISFELDCGYYSRIFSIKTPKSYILSQDEASSGSKYSGTVFITVNRYLGSQVPEYRLLDDSKFTANLIVPNSGSQNNAMTIIAAQLAQFLGASFTIFTATGANYPALQSSINATIPDLMSNMTALNVTLQEKSASYAHELALFEDANEEYRHGLALWLTLLFGTTTAVTLLTYFVMVRCPNLSLVTLFSNTLSAALKPFSPQQADVEMDPVEQRAENHATIVELTDGEYVGASARV